MKQIASPSSMHDETGCSWLVHWDDPEEWNGEGVGRGSGWGTHTPVADSCQCMAKSTTIL